MPRDNEFLDRWLKRRKNVEPEKLSRYSIRNDKWDRDDFAAILKQMPDFSAMRQKLADFPAAGELGYDVYADTLWSFMKVEPELLDDKTVRPSHILNRFVMTEAMQLPDWEQLRIWTEGDVVGSALAVNTIEPDLETIYDRLEEAKKMLEELEKDFITCGGLAGEKADVEKLIEELEAIINGGGGTPTDEQQQQMDDLQGRADELEKSLEEVQKRIEELVSEAQDEMNDARGEVKGVMKAALDKAADDAEQFNNASQSWGMEPGALQRLPAAERLALAKKFNTNKMRRIAQLIGPMKRLAFTEQRRKVNYAPEEVYDVEMGRNLQRALPTELAQLGIPGRDIVFLKNFAEGRILQYAMRGHERVGKGGIICCTDNSGSMGGDNEIWAKAVGLTLLHIARKDKRSFQGIHFGWKSEIKTFDFRDTRNLDPNKVIDFAEFFFNGGTDFQTPLTLGLKWLQEEHDRFGAVKGDIVFITDGYCNVNDQWLIEFKKEQKRLGFNVWGVCIGGSPDAEPLRTICDGRIATITSLQSGENMRDVFGGLGGGA